MDPRICLMRILYHISRGDSENAKEAWLDLSVWTQGGGFAPDYLKTLGDFIDWSGARPIDTLSHIDTPGRG